MNYKLLHIFRNTPFGRETFFHSLHFCRTIHVDPVVYIPAQDKFLMYFEKDTVQVDLDPSYLASPETARDRVSRLVKDAGMSPAFYVPREFSASSLPDISTDFDYMCCPRSVSDQSSKIGLDHIGPKVRRIIQHASFPMLITNSVFKPWKSISVLFGGSNNATKALKLGLKICIASGFPLRVFTLMEKHGKSYYRDLLKKSELLELVEQHAVQWLFYEKTDLDRMLYDVPHDTLLVLGAYGHGRIKDLLLGSKLELIKSTLTNTLMIAGPKSRIRLR